MLNCKKFGVLRLFGLTLWSIGHKPVNLVGNCDLAVGLFCRNCITTWQMDGCKHNVLLQIYNYFCLLKCLCYMFLICSVKKEY